MVQVREEAYRSGDGRELLYADIATAIVRKKVTGQVAQPQRAEIARLKTPARLVELGRGLRLTRSSSGKPPSQ
jgi:hypothetical protein